MVKLMPETRRDGCGLWVVGCGTARTPHKPQLTTHNSQLTTGRAAAPTTHNPQPTTGRAAGFTLIELLVVVTIVGLLAGIAVVNVLGAQRKAAENVLKADLALMRQGIDNFYADKQRYPSSLEELVEAKYMRRIPVDPITKSADTWIPVTEEVEFDGGGFGGSFGSDFDYDAPTGPGIADVKSGAEGETLDGVPYGEL